MKNLIRFLFFSILLSCGIQQREVSGPPNSGLSAVSDSDEDRTPRPSPLPVASPCDPGSPRWPGCLPSREQINQAFSSLRHNDVYFWTQQGLAQAMDLAAEAGGYTLEGQLDAAGIHMPSNTATRALRDEQARNPTPERARLIARLEEPWQWASEALAQRTRGVVFLATDFAEWREDSYWLRYELRALRENPNVTAVVHYPRGGVPSVMHNFTRERANVETIPDEEILQTRNNILAANAARTFAGTPNDPEGAWGSRREGTGLFMAALHVNQYFLQNFADPSSKHSRALQPTPTVDQNKVLWGGYSPPTSSSSRIVLYSLVPVQRLAGISESQVKERLLRHPVLAAHFTSDDIDPYLLIAYESYQSKKEIGRYTMQQLGLPFRPKASKKHAISVSPWATATFDRYGDWTGQWNRLKKRLTDAGHNVNFFGSKTDSSDPSIKLDGLANGSISNIRDLVKRGNPQSSDFILLEVGTNDMKAAGVDLNAAVKNFEGLLDELTTRDPGAVVLVSSLYWSKDDTTLTQNLRFNSRIKKLIQEKITAGKKVSYVPAGDIGADDLAPDGVRLGNSGLDKMAAHWDHAISGFLSRLTMKAELGAPCDKTYLNDGGTGPVAGRGAKVPWEEIQAEDAETNALKIGPCRTKWNADHIEAEAIGRKAVALEKAGDYVRFKPTKPFNTLLIRYSVPDTVSGGGADYKIGVYVNGNFVQHLDLTSKYSWNYGGERLGNPDTDTPGPLPHTFFDEASMIFPAFKDTLTKGGGRNSFANAIGGEAVYYNPGTVVELRRDASSTGDFIVIDLADFEEIKPAEVSPPAGFDDATKLGIFPNGKDYAQKIEQYFFINPKAEDDPKKNIRKLWFPPGKFLVENFRVTQTDDGKTIELGDLGVTFANLGIDCHDCEVRGAGMWYTVLAGRRAMFFCLGGTTEPMNPKGCKFSNFRMSGEAKFRAEEVDGPNKAFAGPLGQSTTIDDLWIDHYVAGIWVGNDPPYQVVQTTGLKIKNVRIRNIYADGINFANGTSKSSAENVHIRNSGDDGIAIWSVNWKDWVKEKSFADPNMPFKSESIGADSQGAGNGNSFRNISVQMPWRANCFAVYGGYNNVFENSTCEDVLTYPGILIDNEFSPYEFGEFNGTTLIPKGGMTKFSGITIKRAGGQMFNDLTPNPELHGALKLYTREGDVSNISIENVDIISPTYSGIEFRGFSLDQLRKSPAGVLERMEPDLMKKALSATFNHVELKNITVTDPGTASILLEKGVRNRNDGPSVTLQSVKIDDNYFENISGIPMNTFFKGTFSNQGGSAVPW